MPTYDADNLLALFRLKPLNFGIQHVSEMTFLANFLHLPQNHFSNKKAKMFGIIVCWLKRKQARVSHVYYEGVIA